MTICLRGLRWFGQAPVDLWIDGDRVVAPGSAALEVDVGDLWAMPPLGDLHLHIDKALSYGRVSFPGRPLDLAAAIDIWADLERDESRSSRRARMEAVARRIVGHGTGRLRTHVNVTPQVELTALQDALALRERLADEAELEIVALPGPLTARQRDILQEAAALGVDALGGAPALDPDPSAALKFLFELAQRRDLPLDLHVDETDDPRVLTVREVVERTLATGYEGRVRAGHCCSLASLPREQLDPILSGLRRARIPVIVLPLSNLYLQPEPGRGMAPVRALLDAGVSVTVASDNIQDPFCPYGRGQVLEVAQLCGLVARMGDPAAMRVLVNMVARGPVTRETPWPALPGVGALATMTLWPVKSAAQLLAEHPDPVGILCRGRWLRRPGNPAGAHGS